MKFCISIMVGILLMLSFEISIYCFLRFSVKTNSMMKLRIYLIFVTLYCMLPLFLSCGSKEKQREKELRILFSREFVDEQYSQERYLSDSYKHHAVDFFAAKNDTFPLAKWDILLDELDKLKRYKPEMNDVGHKHNYCANLEIEFFDHEKSFKPWNKLIGTPEKDKMNIILENTGHGLPKDTIIKYQLEFLKKYN